MANTAVYVTRCFSLGTMDTILCLIGFSTLLVIRGALGLSNGGKLQITSNDLYGGAYADGYKQILTAGLSPKCKERALNELAAAHETDATMTCEGLVENAEDIGYIIGTALNSVGRLVTDLNTVINSAPMCWTEKAWYDYPGKILCLLGHFPDIWMAIKDFWNYKNYIMETVDVIKEYSNCIHNKKVTFSRNVQVIVETARLCR